MMKCNDLQIVEQSMGISNVHTNGGTVVISSKKGYNGELFRKDLILRAFLETSLDETHNVKSQQARIPHACRRVTTRGIIEHLNPEHLAYLIYRTP